jgi:hypothetical protein
MFFDVIRDDFDGTPTAAAMHMQLLLKWLQIDAKFDNFLFETAGESREIGVSFRGFKFAEVVEEKFIETWREKAYYPSNFVLAHLQKETLLAKLPDKTKSFQWAQHQQQVVDTLKHTSHAAVSVTEPSVTTYGAGKGGDPVSNEDREAFCVLRGNFSLLNPRPTEIPGDALLESEDADSKFTFLGAEQDPEGGTTLKGELDRYKQEVTAGRVKILEDAAFIPTDDELTNEKALGEVQTALTQCNGALEEKQRETTKKLQELYKGIFSTNISQGTISSDNMMPIFIGLMLNRKKPAISDSGKNVTLEFSAKKIRVTMSRGQYQYCLKTTRSYLLNATILRKIN